MFRRIHFGAKIVLRSFRQRFRVIDKKIIRDRYQIDITESNYVKTVK